MFSLSDIKVLELASVLAGPSVGQFFAELGAEVIKIENERQGGDVTRSWKLSEEKDGDLSAYFCSVNWGKKSVALDLSGPDGRDTVKKLAARSDIVVASYKPGDAAKLGVDYQTLRSVNPSLIYGQITGYGRDNSRVGYDAVIQAESGFMDLNGLADGPPTKMPVALIDLLAAHQLKEGLLLALLKKAKTGEGSFVEVSLIQAAVSSLANQASNWLVAGHLPKRQGSAHPNIAPYGEFFTTADDKLILLAVGSDKQFADLCMLIGMADLATSGKYQKNQLRVINRKQLHSVLQEQVSKLESSELLRNLHAKKIPAGSIQNLKEVFEMPEVATLVMSAAGLKGVRTFVATPSGFSNTSSLTPPPHLGQHTEEVISKLRS
ncbi:MAG: CaiB/BaiF CoA transferase family protein [Cyclobacteriaceae bacterium]